LADVQKRLFSPWLYRLARWALGAVFVYAGTVKLMDPGGFATVISRYGMAPEFLIPVAALGLPTLELVAGAGLLLDLKGSLSAIFAMLLLFAAVLWFGALNGLDIDCGCFSSSELAEQDSLRQALHRDLIMLAAAVYLYLWRWRRREAREAVGWRYVYQSNSREVRT
jgi:uncharacterized membrane protein YphA (DoxX/SURF4 family)